MNLNDAINALPVVVDVASKVVAGAAVIAAITPTPKDDNVLSKIRKVLDFLAFNFGFSRNGKK